MTIGDGGSSGLERLASSLGGQDGLPTASWLTDLPTQHFRGEGKTRDLDLESWKAEIADNLNRMEAAFVLAKAQSEELKVKRAKQFSELQVTSGKSSLEGFPILEFQVGEERMAVPAERAVAIVTADNLYPLPLAPGHVPYTLGFRGTPVLVLSLHVLQGLAIPAFTEATRLVVVHWQSGMVALIADDVNGVRSIDRGRLSTSPDHAWLTTKALLGELPDGVNILDLGGLAAQIAALSPNVDSQDSGTAL